MDVNSRKVGEAIATVPEEHGAEPPPGGLRFNDGKASPGGVLIVGRMHMNFSEGEPGRLYRSATSVLGHLSYVCLPTSKASANVTLQYIHPSEACKSFDLKRQPP